MVQIEKLGKNKQTLIFVIFLILTFILMFFRPPFWDEANAWMISKSFNIVELFQVEKYEGHFFLWYLVQMPFSKNNFFYPYSIYVLNWLFCAGAFYLFFKNAPFKLLTKTLVLFSYPVFWYFAQVARCYSIGLLFFFLILSLWEKRLEKPVIISILIFLTMNTSAMGAIAVFPISLFLLYDLFKNKKSLLIPIAIMSFGAILVLFQLTGSSFVNDCLKPEFIKRFIEFFIFQKGIIGTVNFFMAFNILFLLIFSIVYFLKNEKGKRGLLYILLTYLPMVLIFTTRYSGSWWHYLFFYIFFISALWLFNLESKIDNKILKGLILSLLILLNVKTLIFPFDFHPTVYESKAYLIQKIIKKENLFKDINEIYVIDNVSDTSTGILPYFPDMDFIDTQGVKKYTVKGMRYNADLCRGINFDELASKIDNSKTNYAISTNKLIPYIDGFQYKLIFDPVYERFGVFYVYKISSAKIQK